MSSVMRVLNWSITVCILITQLTCVCGEVLILTSTDQFEIKNGTAMISFTLQGAGFDTFVSITKRLPCVENEEQIYIGEYLTPGARRGITVSMPYKSAESGHTYEINFDNAQDTDLGTYTVNAIRRTSERYEPIISRSLTLVRTISEDSPPVCNNRETRYICSNTGWIAGFSVVFVMLLFVLCINIFLCVRFRPNISDMFRPESTNEDDEDIYVLRNVGSTQAAGTEPTDDYEDVDELVNRKDSATKDDPGDNVSDSSVPADIAPSLPATETDYYMPDVIAGEKTETETEDPELDVPDSRSSNSNMAPTLPGHNRPVSEAASIRLPSISESGDITTDQHPSDSKPKIPPKTRPRSSVLLTRASNAPIPPVKKRPQSSIEATVLEADVIVDPYERINYKNKETTVPC